MLINLRNALMAGKRLPYDAEVEYLQSSGTQYIDTGVVGGSSSKVEISASSTNTAKNMGLFGSRNASLVKAFTIWQRVTNTSVRFDFAGDTTNRVIANAAWETSGVNTVVKDGPNNTLNGVAGANNATATFTCEYPFYLFSINTSGTATSNASARVYSCKIWQNGVLVRDYIPVRKKTVGYLYDRVSGKLFGNAGTGDFVVGQDVVPVEYIESTGTQWIDTGVPTADRYIFEWLCTDATRDVKLFGNSYAYGKYRDLSIYNSTYRGTNIATESNSWDRVEIDVTRPSLTVTRNGSAFGTASSWYAAYTRTSPETQYGTALPLGGHVNANGTWYGTNRITSFYTQYGTKLRTRLFEAWNGLDMKERLLPVRVGTDATSWEGAMMDVLTRRIYRNAGTGAFTFGNDLKYPIPAE